MSGWTLRILVLGGYGFIGAEIVRALLREGHQVVGLGRSAATGNRLVPDAEWIGADIAGLDAPQKWAPHHSGIDAIVNAAGALQESPRDRLASIHHLAIAACVTAAENAGVRRFVQISAVGATASASTAFMRTKAAGDAAVRAAALDWVIFKPGLVIGRNAFGGTALLRLLAAMPLIEALAYPDAKVQTVSIDDVSAAVARALAGETGMRADYDLVEPEPHALRDIIRLLRRWLGFGAPALSLTAPRFVVRLLSTLADMAGLLGWRSPLRSTAMRVMGENVLGDPAPWKSAIGRPLKSFEETLRDMPSTAQERVYARAQIAIPIMVTALAAFWLLSGVIGFARIDAAAAHLPGFGAAATLVVIGGALADLFVGAAIAWRPTARKGAIASILLALFYLATGTWLAPALWADPLGVYVKVLPAIALGAAAALLLEER